MDQHSRTGLTIASWVAFLWMLISVSLDKPVSDALWINITYICVLIATTMVLWLATFVLVGRTFMTGLGIPVIIASFVALIFLGFESFAFRDWIVDQF